MNNFDAFVFIDEEALNKNLEEDRGIYPKERSIEDFVKRGFILLDKPSGPTSHDVVATVKKILNIGKAGHAGTLDPAVSGVLPIGLMDGTKILGELSGAEKHYICNLRLHEEIDSDKLEKVLEEFSNQIFQFPPVKSNVAMRLRKRTIYSMKLLEQNGSEYLLDIICEAGTYIRTLCTDIGRVLGVGGEMKELRRVTSAGFSEKETVTLHELFDAYQDAVEGITLSKLKQVIRPIEEILMKTPRVIIRNNAVSSFSHGAKLAVPAIIGSENFRRNEIVQVITCKGELVGLGETLCSSDQLIENESGFIVQPNRVIFDRNEY